MRLSLLLAMFAFAIVCSKTKASFFDTDYDCSVSEWTAWSEPFGFGQISRHRKILRHPNGNGIPCPQLEDIKYTGVRPTVNQTASLLERNFIQPYTASRTTRSAQKSELRDLLIITDSSGSITSTGFTQAKSDLARLMGLFCPLNNPFEKGYQHAAMLNFARYVIEEFDFATYSSTAEVQDGILKATYLSGGTCTDKAFQDAITMFTTAKGARSELNVKREVLIITDGQSNCGDAVAAAKDLHDVAEVFGLMVGNYSQTGMDELTSYVSTPAANHLFNIPNIRDLDALITIVENEKIKRGAQWCAHFQN